MTNIKRMIFYSQYLTIYKKSGGNSMQNLLTKEVKLKMIPWLLIGILGSLLTLGIPYLVQSLLDNGDGKNIFQNVMLIVALLFLQLLLSFSAHYG